ncbi:hypothetical protein [Aphanothece sacrum]|uniref:Uncharacterized protein n=1 Tax=Aphanothece sacrum FPU1 TaxID=1920663 RepID=A0A401IDC0_APHSA|nr:hypothetical protein [Aphanothece sacrum]GBF79189.1 hypothetical protein AsFPU1_0581 [Aphanothece sacrum FPU1]GBF86578.1 hypothetical protein AsFPU3_3649 [Aphanothece sacrum FPU3]
MNSLDSVYQYLLENICFSKDINYLEKQKKLFELGVKSSLLFYEFIKFIIKDVRNHELEKIYYFTREGEFFQKIHDIIVEHSPDNSIKSELVEASRLTTFSPSLQAISIEELKRLWRMYSTQSMGAMLKSLNVNNFEFFTTIFKSYDIDIDIPIEKPWLDLRVKKVFADPLFQKNIKTCVDIKKHLLQEYLLNKGLNEQAKKIAMVDIGWRGTTQDNLALLFKDTTIHAYYLGMQPFLNPQPNNIIKQSFLGDQVFLNRRQELVYLKYVSPIEMMCNSPSGTTIDYQNIEGEIRAIRKTIELENDIFYEYTQFFQQGVLEGIKSLVKLEQENPNLFKNTSKFCIKIANDLWMNPKKFLTEAYFQLHHDETFGVGEIINKGEPHFIPMSLILQALFNKKKWDQLGLLLADTGWIQGLFTYYNLGFLNPVYNLRIKMKSKPLLREETNDGFTL